MPVTFDVVQSLSHVLLPETPLQHVRLLCPPLSISPNFLRHMCIESVMLSNHLILCLSLLLLFPSIRVFSNEPALRIRRPKYWNFSISLSNEYSGLISFRMDWWKVLTKHGPLAKGTANHSRILALRIP